MGNYMRHEHGPYCHRMECPGCYDEWREYEKKKEIERQAKEKLLINFIYHCEFGRNVTKRFKTTKEAIKHRMLDCISIAYFPEGSNTRTVIWTREESSQQNTITLEQMIAAAQRIILDRHRQLVPGPGIDLEADSKYNDELTDIASSLTEAEIIRYTKILS